MSKRKMQTMDGNTAAAYVSYAFTDVAAIYPITPSSTMAEKVDEWVTQGVTNLFGQKVRVMVLATTQLRERLAMDVQEALDNPDTPAEAKAVFQEWFDHKDETAGTRDRAEKVTAVVTAAKDSCPMCKRIYERRDCLVKRSQWILGGDGWSYDIGYGGLDHVLASGANVNVLVFDTEVYSNTGGQSSKVTPTAAVAKFAAGGKKTKKKDLGRIFMQI